MQLAHLGVATMIVGAALTSVYSTEKSVLLSPGERMNLGGYAFEFVGAKPITGPNFRGMEATLEVYRGEEFLRELHPERRLYLASGTPSTEMAIDAGFWRDFFVTLGEEKGRRRLVDDYLRQALCALGLARCDIYVPRRRSGSG
jgi:cytochrome c-type biogenesis protein CcmF